MILGSTRAGDVEKLNDRKQYLDSRYLSHKDHWPQIPEKL